nr:hypothetical protein [Tanacetum cinerariifolium]
MRVNNESLSEIDKHKTTTFAQWLLDVGNGKIGIPDDSDLDNTSWVDIQDEYCIPNDDNGIPNLINFIYDADTLHRPSAQKLQEKAIISPKIDTIDYFNFAAYNELPAKVNVKNPVLTDTVKLPFFPKTVLHIHFTFNSGNIIQLALWHEMVLNFNIREYETMEKPVVIALSGTSATHYYLNPNIPETKHIKEHNQANFLIKDCSELLAELPDKNPYQLPSALKELEVITIPQRVKKAITDNPKKLATLINLVNLHHPLKEFLGQSQGSQLGCFRRVWSYIKENNLQDPNNKNIVNCDAKLKSVLLDTAQVVLAELPMLVKLHFPKQQNWKVIKPYSRVSGQRRVEHVTPAIGCSSCHNTLGGLRRTRAHLVVFWSHGWRQLVSTKSVMGQKGRSGVIIGLGQWMGSCTKPSDETIPYTIKGKPLVLSWGRTPRLDFGVRARPILGFPNVSLASVSGTLVRQGSACNRDLRIWFCLVDFRCPAKVSSRSPSSVLLPPDRSQWKKL